MVEVNLPELGEDIEDATISFWHVEEGEHIVKDADLVEITTDKATFNVPSPVTGILVEVIAHEGENVQVGNLIARIQEDD